MILVPDGPPPRATSRLIVEGARRSEAAIVRSAVPCAMPREISSRSKNVSAVLRRWRVGGAKPPLALMTQWIELECFSSARPISLSDWPVFACIKQTLEGNA